jgi:DNA ligase-1
MIQKPMLAATLEPEDLKTLKYPVLATPKLDGIRCLIVNGKAVSRKFKPIPNHYIRKTLESFASEGFDGEIIIKGATFNEISSAVMSEDGNPSFVYVVFDYCKEPSEGYSSRLRNMWKVSRIYRELGRENQFINFLFEKQINNESELLSFETKCLSEGYEGIMLRSANSPYKFGRSTLKEGYLLKFKRFTDGEAQILSLYEKMHNTNEATMDELGHTKRSSHLAGQIPANTLGGFNVQDLKSGQKFSIGTGLDDALRQTIWSNPQNYLGKIIKYKSQKVGEKDLPRFPTFLGFRDKRDM